MTTGTAVKRRTLTPEEIRALPAVLPAERTICAVWGISPATYYRLLAEKDLPVPTFTVGRSRKVNRADVLRALQLADAPGAI
ncbi:DNA-binding protein [Actinacidiphila sp. DG2A-62]|uniref:DNA-binding protein n=1 Tax=Actinacidiphila sp. DG2A-62 TaxID=3108821 RepID=UPI002DB733A4|nr:DNA-binding protein [Actinacidiphila sp. DG2A-62]MEC3995076.1 DNA-binding protein [Actinacidiphila sp. DG2A-62]